MGVRQLAELGETNEFFLGNRGEMEDNGRAGQATAETVADPNQDTDRGGESMAHAKRTTAPAFQFYPKDFLSSTKVDEMTMTERGVYITLMSRCWMDDGLPSDLPALARMARMKVSQFERLWNNGPLHECFYQRDEKLHHRRLDEERKKQHEYHRRQSDNGKKGGRPSKAVGSPGLSKTEPSVSFGLSQTEAKKSSSSASSSASALGERGTPPPRLAPIHDKSHLKHAVCGRVCIAAAQFGEFVRRRNHDGAEAEIRAWANRIVDLWTHGAHANDEPGEIFDFWRARYAETWPPSSAAAPRTPVAQGPVYQKVRA